MSITGLDPTSPAPDGPAGGGDDELRNLKSALQNCLGGPGAPGMDGPVQKDGAYPTSAEWSDIFTRLDALDGGVGTGFIGEIKVYYGDIANIPAGWFLANGTNGTQNLTGRMLIGDSRTQPIDGELPLYDDRTFGGDLPGSQTTGPGGQVTASVTIGDHVITANNLPQHTHYMASGGETSQGNLLSASGSMGRIGATNGGTRDYELHETDNNDTPFLGNTGLGGGINNPQALVHSGNSVTIPDHNHTLSGSSLPPWHAVYYIQYIGV